ncbi:hypothetical protein EDC94DRAFT_691156 [Helicostylum pulchrum]|nr:hypothetical protein EDC94DRAFT_691156 [Helicostylum pulchrum]
MDNLGVTINNLKEEAIAAKEKNMSLKEEPSSLENKINMIYSSVGNDLFVSSPRFAGEATNSLPSDVQEKDELLLGKKAAPFLPLAAYTGRWGGKMLLMRIWHRTFQYYIDEDEEEEGENRVAAQTILRQEEQEEQEE